LLINNVVIQLRCIVDISLIYVHVNFNSPFIT